MTRTTQLSVFIILLALFVAPQVALAVDEAPVPPATGTIQVCSIIIDAVGDMRTNSPLPAITITQEGRTEGTLTLPNTTFMTPLVANLDAVAAFANEDASCVDYPEFAFGTYAYGEASYSNDADYDEPLYFDAQNTDQVSIPDFKKFKEPGVESADGFITIDADHPVARIFSLSTYLPCGPVAEGETCGSNTGDESETSDTTQTETPPPPAQGGGGIYVPTGPVVEIFHPEPAPSVVSENTTTAVGGEGNAGTSCELPLTSHMRRGRTNDTNAVLILQKFLNEHMGAGLNANGEFDEATETAVKSFQDKYAVDVLKPWGNINATGIVYLTTLKKINQLRCGSYAAIDPILVPWID